MRRIWRFRGFSSRRKRDDEPVRSIRGRLISIIAPQSQQKPRPFHSPFPDNATVQSKAAFRLTPPLSRPQPSVLAVFAALLPLGPSERIFRQKSTFRVRIIAPYSIDIFSSFPVFLGHRNPLQERQRPPKLPLIFQWIILLLPWKCKSSKIQQPNDWRSPARGDLSTKRYKTSINSQY